MAQGFTGNHEILQNFINKHAGDLENVQRNKKKEKVTGKAWSLFEFLGVGASVGHSFRNLVLHSLTQKKKKNYVGSGFTHKWAKGFMF